MLTCWKTREQGWSAGAVRSVCRTLQDQTRENENAVSKAVRDRAQPGTRFGQKKKKAPRAGRGTTPDGGVAASLRRMRRRAACLDSRSGTRIPTNTWRAPQRGGHWVFIPKGEMINPCKVNSRTNPSTECGSKSREGGVLRDLRVILKSPSTSKSRESTKNAQRRNGSAA